MKTRIAAAVAAVLLGAAPVTSALAYSEFSARPVPMASGWNAPLGVHDSPFYGACPMSSASEGNANQQNFPVKQYGQTSGGQRC